MYGALGYQTASSSLRPMQALSCHTQTLLDTIGFQCADRDLDVKVVLEAQGH